MIVPPSTSIQTGLPKNSFGVRLARGRTANSIGYLEVFTMFHQRQLKDKLQLRHLLFQQVPARLTCDLCHLPCYTRLWYCFISVLSLESFVLFVVIDLIVPAEEDVSTLILRIIARIGA